MSQENVETVRAWLDAWNATGDLDLSAFDPGLIYTPAQTSRTQARTLAVMPTSSLRADS